jgi:glycerate dehydrogenase
MKIVLLDGYTINPGDNLWDEVAMLSELTIQDPFYGTQCSH